MDRKRIIGWWMFDWASQPYFTLGLTFIFGPYFASVAAEFYLTQGLDEQAADAGAQSLWSLGQTITGIVIAISAPILGAIADTNARRMPWIIAFSVLYVAGAWALWLVVPDGSMLIFGLCAFGLGLIGAEVATIFTSALLPGLGPRSEIGRISGTGFAIGYAGGVVALFMVLLFMAERDTGQTLIGLAPGFGLLDASAMEGTRATGPFIAIWYVIFMIPFFAWVRETPGRPAPGGAARALRDLGATIRSLPGRVSLFAYLGSSMFYRDALNALYSFGGTYAVLVLNWEIVQVAIFGIIGAIAAALASWVGGMIDSARGPKPLIRAMILALIALCAFIPGLTPGTIWGLATDLVDPVFMVLGAVIGGAGGVLQSASRTMMVRHADPDRATEAFGLYALSGKATTFLGPALIAAVTYLAGDARLGVIPLIALFALGLFLLSWVRPEGTEPPPEPETAPA